MEWNSGMVECFRGHTLSRSSSTLFSFGVTQQTSIVVVVTGNQHDHVSSCALYSIPLFHGPTSYIQVICRYVTQQTSIAVTGDQHDHVSSCALYSIPLFHGLATFK